MKTHSRQPYHVLFVGVLLLGFHSSWAQERNESLNFYAIEDLTSEVAVRRGSVNTDHIPRGGLILSPSTTYRMWRYDSSSGLVGNLEFTTARAGRQFEIPAVQMRRTMTGDRDADGLSDEIEFILGTSPNTADTDQDGTPDGAEIEQGTDPLDGLQVQTGLIAAVDAEGTALDVTAFNNIVILANAEEGISVFNVFNRMNPTIIADVDTLGRAKGVAFGAGTRIAVADGPAGVAIVDISDPANAGVVSQILLSGDAEAVSISAELVFAGSSSGHLVVIDINTGRIVAETFDLSERIHDLIWSGDELFVLTAGELTVYGLEGSLLTQLGQFTGVRAFNNVIERHRFSVGGGVAYIAYQSGFQTIDISDPRSISELGNTSFNQLGWRHIVPNGSGLALAANGVTPQPSSGDDNIAVYEVRDPANLPTVTQSVYPTPGAAYAVTIYNGLGYISDGSAGLQVVNYVSADVSGIPPNITFQVDTPTPGEIEEGQILRLAAQVSDDVQVRNVEFYVDGRLAATDGNFPFEYRFRAPPLEGRTNVSMTVSAVATDTGGNRTRATPSTLTVLPDQTPPSVVAASPINGAVRGGNVRTATVTFSEVMDTRTLTTDNVAVRHVGGARIPPSGQLIRWDGQEIELEFDTPFPPGDLEIVVNGNAVTDLAGNSLGTGEIVATTFQVVEATIAWTNLAGGFWDDPNNWDSGRLPGPEDDVVIGVPGDVTITYRSGGVPIRSLLSDNMFAITGGELEATERLHFNKNAIFRGGTIRGGTIGTEDGTELEILSASTLDGVVLNGEVRVGNGVLVTILNGLELNGTLTLEHTRWTNATSLDFPGEQSLTGSGTVVSRATTQRWSANTANFVRATEGGTLTIGPDITIRGDEFTLGSPGHGLINRGTIQADSTGDGDVRQYHRIQGANWVNEGTLRASNGAVLELLESWSNSGAINGGDSEIRLDGTWTNEGTVEMTSGAAYLSGEFATSDINGLMRNEGTVFLSGSLNNEGQTLNITNTTGPNSVLNVTIAGGSIDSPDGTELEILSASTLDGVVLNGEVRVGNGVLVTILNGLELNGTLTLEHTRWTNATSLDFPGEQSLTGSGTVVSRATTQRWSANTANFVRATEGGTLTIGPDITIRGDEFTLGSPGQGLINRGTILADSTGDGNVRQHHRIQGANWANEGTLRASNGAVLELLESWSNTGVIDGGDSEIRLDGTWSNEGSVEMTSGAAYLSGEFATSDINGLRRNEGTVFLSGSLNNEGQTLNITSTTGPSSLLNVRIAGGSIDSPDGRELEILSASTLDDVVLNGDVSMGDGVIVTVLNGLELNGTLTLEHTVWTNATSLDFPGEQRLTGNGTVVSRATTSRWNTRTANFVRATEGGTLTIGPDITIRGDEFTLGSPGQGLINRGTILADSTGDGNARQYHRIQGANWANEGTLRATNGAVLELLESWSNTGAINGGDSEIRLDGTWSNTGTVEMTSGAAYLSGEFATSDINGLMRNEGMVFLSGSLNNEGQALNITRTTGPSSLLNVSIAGGSIDSPDGTELEILSASTLDGVALNGDVRMGDGVIVTVLNGLELNGTLTLEHTVWTNATSLDFPGEQSLSGSGTVVSRATTSRWNTRTANFVHATEGGTLTIGPDITIRGDEFTLGSPGQGLINRGTILADSTGDGNVRQYHRIQGANWVNEGTLRASNGAVLELLESWSNTGAINGGDSEIRLDGTWSNTGTVEMTSGAAYLSGEFATSDINGLMRNEGMVFLSGSLNNEGQALNITSTTGPSSLLNVSIAGGSIDSPDGTELEILSASTLDGVALNGDVRMGDGVIVTVLNGLELNGTLTLEHTVWTNATSLDFPGEQSLSGSGTVVSRATTSRWNTRTANFVHATEGGTLTIGPDITIRGDEFTLGSPGQGLINRGTILADSTGDGNVRQYHRIQGANWVNEGTLRASNGAVLELLESWSNTGMIDVNAGSVVRVEGTLIAADTSTISFGIQGTGDNQSGRMIVTGEATLSGSIKTEVAEEATLEAGDRLEIMTFASRSGNFATTSGFAFSDDLRFELDESSETALRLVVVEE